MKDGSGSDRPDPFSGSGSEIRIVLVAAAPGSEMTEI